MRFTVRRIRRKLPKAIIMLGAWNSDMAEAALEQLRENAKADLACRSLHEAVDACIKAATPATPESDVQQVSAIAS
jgi:histone acetyltransferase (RNA polymerase elongator complex component)